MNENKEKDARTKGGDNGGTMSFKDAGLAGWQSRLISLG